MAVEHHSVVIIGGGIGGLHTAFRLHEAKQTDIKLYEGRGALGGRVVTTRDDDGTPMFNDFAWRIGETNINMLALTKELDIELRQQVTPEHLTHSGSHSDTGEDTEFAHAHETPSGRAPLSAYATQCLQSTKGADSIDRASGYAGRNAQISFPGETHGNVNYVVVNGMNDIAQKLADKLPPGIVNPHHRCDDVRKLGDGRYLVELVIRDGNNYSKLTVTCDTLVLAAPPVSLRKFTIAKEEGLFPVLFAIHQRRLMHGYVKSSPKVEGSVVPDRSDVDSRIYRGIPDSILQQVVSGDYGHGIWQAAYACDRFERVWRELQFQGPEGVKAEIEKQLLKLDIPAVKGLAIDQVFLRSGFVHRWHIEAHANGKTKEELQSQAVYPQPVQLPRLHLVGEAYSSQQGWTEGALLTSLAVVYHILNKPTASNSKHAQILPQLVPKAGADQMSYRGLVIDVSNWRERHPGGKGMIQFHGGEVIDELFDNFHAGWPAPLATLFGMQEGVLQKALPIAQVTEAEKALPIAQVTEAEKANEESGGRVTIFTLKTCPHCQKAKALLTEYDVDYYEVSLASYPEKRSDMLKLSNRLTVPQIFFDDQHIGGAASLEVLHQAGTLKGMLSVLSTSSGPTNQMLDRPSYEPVVEEFEAEAQEELLCVGTDCVGYADMVKELAENLSIKTRSYRLGKYKKCFLGRDLVNFLLRRYSLKSREEAVQVGISLIDSCVLEHVSNGHSFEDNGLFYRLMSDTEPRVLNRFKILDSSLKSTSDPIKLVMKCKKLYSDVEDKYMDKDGKVDFIGVYNDEDYKAFQLATCEFQRLDLAAMSVNMRLAFCINLYNLCIHQGYAQVGVPKTGLQRNSFFTSVKVDIGGLLYSFNDLENGVLRGNAVGAGKMQKPFGRGDPRLASALERPPPEPRIHFALNCGAKSCPPIKSFTAEAVQEELEIVSQAFLEEGTNNLVVDSEKKILKLTKILRWYRVDFGANKKEVATTLLQWLRGADKEKVQALLDGGKFKIKYFPYDWASQAKKFKKFGT